MAETNPNHHSIDPKSGFCSETKIFNSLRPRVHLPPLTSPLSVSEHALSLLRKSSSSLKTTIAFIESSTGNQISFSDFIRQTETLSYYLQNSIGLSKGDAAYILSPPSLEIPILIFSLLSLGVIISPANPISTKDEISRQIDLTKPAIAFATSATVHKLPLLHHRTILIDSSDFRSVLRNIPSGKFNRVEVNQSDTAAILYSSGTTGRVKGVILTHRNFIGLITGFFEIQFEKEEENSPQPVSLFTVPLFHVFGFFMCIRAVAMAETVVLMERFDFVEMLKAIQNFKVTYMPVSPPLVVAMAKLEVVGKYDLSSLQLLGCGGAPLGKEVAEKFTARLPHVQLVQGYGLTESAGGASKMIGPDETKHFGSVGRLAENTEAKIVDPVTGEALAPGQQGELWLRSPFIMKGYVGDDEATASTLDPEGWLKTGDLCYFDSEGFLFVVDRLKELIKYKAYQVPPAELEHLLQAHPEIADAAVIPYPDEEAGQIPMAFVVRKPGSNLSEAQVKDFIAKQSYMPLLRGAEKQKPNWLPEKVLMFHIPGEQRRATLGLMFHNPAEAAQNYHVVAPYKKIRRVAFINAIPKSPAGKILRRELIDHSSSKHSSKL